MCTVWFVKSYKAIPPEVSVNYDFFYEDESWYLFTFSYPIFLNDKKVIKVYLSTANVATFATIFERITQYMANLDSILFTRTFWLAIQTGYLILELS